MKKKLNSLDLTIKWENIFDISKKTLSVLLIDSNELDLFITGQTLESYGITNIISFKSARKALLHLNKAEIKYNLILVDIYMPILDGFEFINKFRELELDKTQGEICLLSASLNPSHKKKAEEKNIKFIEKPITIKKLLINFDNQFQ